MDNKQRIRARAVGKLARAKGAHARKLARKVGMVAVEAPAVTPEPAKKKRAKNATKKD